MPPQRTCTLNEMKPINFVNLEIPMSFNICLIASKTCT